MKQLAVALFIILMTGCGTVPTTTTTTTPAAQAPAATALSTSPAKIGERVVSGGIALTVNKVERVSKLGTIQHAGAGKEFVLADVLVETVDRDSAPYNPFYFKVKAADGTEYNSTINTKDDSLKSGDLPKGERAKGGVVFEVPKGISGLVLEYGPVVLGGGFSPIRVSLDL